MLIPVITFEMRDPKSGLFIDYCIASNHINNALIAGDRRTRNIHFTSMFEFEFNREFKQPKFVELGSILLNAQAHSCNFEYDAEDLSNVDQMA